MGSSQRSLRLSISCCSHVRRKFPSKSLFSVLEEGFPQCLPFCQRKEEALSERGVEQSERRLNASPFRNTGHHFYFTITNLSAVC